MVMGWAAGWATGWATGKAWRVRCWRRGHTALELSHAAVYALGMREPTPRGSRLVLAGGLIALLAAGGLGFTLGRETARPPAPIPSPVSAPARQAAPPPVEALPALLGRIEILQLVRTAADEVAGGQADILRAREAAGRRFTLQIPFGCDGPAAPGSNDPLQWSYDPAEEALRFAVAPALLPLGVWTGSDAATELVEGFWVPRPWTSSEECLRVPGGAVMARTDTNTGPSNAPPVRTVLLGQVTQAESREGDDADPEPFAAVVRTAPDALAAERGFRLQLGGRLAAIAQGMGGAAPTGPVLCRQTEGGDRPPVCLVLAELDEVAIVNPVTGETLASWDASARRRER